MSVCKIWMKSNSQPVLFTLPSLLTQCQQREVYELIAESEFDRMLGMPAEF